MRSSPESWRCCWVAILTCSTATSQIGCQTWKHRFLRPRAAQAETASAALPMVEPPQPAEPTAESSDIAAILAAAPPPIPDPGPDPSAATDWRDQYPKLRPFVRKKEPTGMKVAKKIGYFVGDVVIVAGYTVVVVSGVAFMIWAKMTADDDDDDDDF